METVAEPVVSEALIDISDYAEKYCVGRRTVDRYARAGKVEKVRQFGKTLIVDKPPEPRKGISAVTEPVELDRFVRQDWVAFGAAKAFAKSRLRWFVTAIILSVLFVVVLLAATWLYQSNETLRTQISDARIVISGLRRQGIETINNSNATQGQLQSRLDELLATNQVLTAQLIELSQETVSTE